MKKYITDQDDSNAYWNYCKINDIPYIVVNNELVYSNIEYDLFAMYEGYKPKAFPHKFIVKLYENYCELFHLPDPKLMLAGGNKNLIFTVFKDHSDFIANTLFDYLDDFVKKSRE